MSESYNGMQDMRDRLIKLETLAVERAVTNDGRFSRIEQTLEDHGKLLEAIRGDIRDAKTGLSVGMAIAKVTRVAVGAVIAVGAWAVGHFWTK